MQPEKLVLISPWFPTSAPDLSALGDAEGDILPRSLLAAGHDLYGRPGRLLLSPLPPYARIVPLASTRKRGAFPLTVLPLLSNREGRPHYRHGTSRDDTLGVGTQSTGCEYPEYPM